MNEHYDIIIFTGVPKGQGLHGLEPSPLPRVQLAPKEKQSDVSKGNNFLLKLGILSALSYLLVKILK